jgi:ADP-ribosylglycohydrolase
MLTRQDLIDNQAITIRKSRGALIGLAVGDALGDLGRDQKHRARYGLATELLPGAKSTDDTEFALLTARMLLDNGGELTPEAVLQAWQTYILAEGGVFDRAGRPLYGAVANLERGMEPPRSGMDNVGNDDDGAAMRITPIGIVCAGEPERAAEMARIEAEISHARDGIWAAQAVAASVSIAMVDGSVEEIINGGLRYIPKDSWLGRAMTRAFRICDRAGDIQGAWAALHSELWTPVHSTAAEAIPQIYALFRLTGGEFRQGLFWAGNFGRDADTIAAVVGALTGARQGIDVVPPAWVEMVRKPAGVALRFAAKEDILALAEDLAGLVR